MDQRIETPAWLPGLRIEGAHRPRRRLDVATVRVLRADNEGAAGDDGRRRDLEFAEPLQRHAGLDFDLAIASEPGAGNPCPGIERDYARVVGAHEDARAAGGILSG